MHANRAKQVPLFNYNMLCFINSYSIYHYSVLSFRGRASRSPPKPSQDPPDPSTLLSWLGSPQVVRVLVLGIHTDEAVASRQELLDYGFILATLGSFRLLDERL